MDKTRVGNPVWRVPYTLVIVDMQTWFKGARDEQTIDACMRQIGRAIRAQCPIIVLELKPISQCGTTDRRLLAMLKNYIKHTVVLKDKNDGSAEVLAACQRHHFGTRSFRICGVNTHACVQATVSGLASKCCYSQLEVVREACNDCMGNQWERFDCAPNVVLVSEKMTGA